jgi:heptosyltransferase-2
VCSRAGETIGFDKNPLSALFTKKIKHEVGGKRAVHETIRNLELIRAFTDASVSRPKLYPSSDDFAAVAELMKPKYVTVSPASVWYTKQYPSDQWISFLKTA